MLFGNSLSNFASNKPQNNVIMFMRKTNFLIVLLLGIFMTAATVNTFGQITFEKAIIDSNDDAEQDAVDGSMYMNSSDLELVEDGSAQIVGLRFTDVLIPQGAMVTNAYIQFTVDETSADATSLMFHGELAENSNPFQEAIYFNISNRDMTTASVEWANVAPWGTVGEAGADQQTPDISSLLNEIVAQEGWEKGNALSIIVTGSGSRIAESWDGDVAGAPKLVVEYYLVKTAMVQIMDGNDDAEENGPASPYGHGGMYFTSSDLELVDDEGSVQTVGLRFPNVDVPQGVQIHNAYVKFVAGSNELESATATLQFKVEKSVDAPAFADVQFDVSGREIFADSIEWAITDLWTEGDDYMTPSIANLIDSVVNQGAWERGNSIAVIINGEGTRRAESYEGSSEDAAMLMIEYLSDKVAPELVEEVPDKHTLTGWSFTHDVKPFFRDEDSELTFTATLSGERELPVWLDFTDGVLSGMSDKAVTLPIFVTAESEGESVTDMFMLSVEPEQMPTLTQIGSIQLGSFDEGAAEISAYDAGSQKLFVTNAEKGMIDIIDMSDPTNLVLLDSIDISTYGGGVNSVAVYDGYLAAAIEAEVKQDPGEVVVFDMEGTFLWQATVGALPDMVTFTPDGTKILVANEGEPSDDYLTDPEGTISIIDTVTKTVATADFTAFNGQEATLAADGVRIFGPGATVAMDLEPEYITVNATSDTAYVTLQENNAVVVVEIATATVLAVQGLGYKDHSMEGYGIDASNKSDFIDIRPWEVKGMYQPDAIASYQVNGKTYLLTANEGDARDYDGYSEESSVEDVELDPVTFPDYEMLQDKNNLGKLNISLAMADTTADGEYKTLYSYGARSFSIWSLEEGLVFDSGDEFEQITAAFLPENFNASNSNNTFKNRSENKGPEPEAITVGSFDGKTYAFIGLERVGGIMVYDITDPMNPMFVEYTNNRDWTLDAEEEGHGDSGPEGLVFIPAGDSPNGQNLLVVSNEVSGTVTVYSAGEAAQPFTLGIFHNNDGESDMLGDSIEYQGEMILAGSVAQFKTTLDSLRQLGVDRGYETIMLSSGDNFLAGKEFNASQALGEYFDAIALDAMDYDAICLGNHDFDFGPEVLAELISSFENNLSPYLSSNLEFSQEASLQDLVDAGRIAPSTIVERNGEQIGIIGLTTPAITNISSPGLVGVSEFIIDSVQAQVNTLTAQGVNKIILISHLQSINEDTALVGNISGVDIVIAGGGDELLINNDDVDPYGQTPFGSYPIMYMDNDGMEVPIVTTPGNYRYIGQLLVDFDEMGHVTRVYDESGPVFVMGEGDQTLIDNVITPISDYIEDLTTNIIATTEVELDFVRANLRTGETNGGNLVADALLWQAMETYESYGVGMPHVALQNAGGLRLENTIPAGDIAEVLTYDICAFDNKLSLVEGITPEKFLELMENGVSNVENVDGRFPHIAGFEIVYNPLGTPGDRIISITLEDGTDIVVDGEVAAGAPNVNMATINFIANGGDFYPFDDMPYTIMGATYQQALYNYLIDENGLDSLVTTADYPVGGEGRVVEQVITPLVTLPFYEDYDDGYEGWKLVNAVGDQVWENGPQYGVDNSPMMVINGYDGGANANEDWMISPAFDLEGFTSVDIAFQSNVRYSGTDLEVKYSIDYDGFENPTDATWTTVPGVTIAQDNSQWIWEPSGTGTISGLSAEHIHFAFIYTSTDSEAATWEVDSVVVNATPMNNAPTVANPIADIAEEEGFTTYTIDLTDVFEDADGDVLTYSAESGTEAVVTVSVDGVTLTVTETGNGTSTITVTADDGNGGTVNDEFSFAVNAAGNNAPTVVNPISDVDVLEEFGTYTVDLTDVFEDADGDDLTYSAVSETTSVVTVDVTGTTLTVTEVGTGVSNITVTANDGNGGTVDDDFEFTVNPNAIEGLNASQIALYPNPTNDNFMIELPTAVDAQVTVFAVTGAVVYNANSQENNIEIDLSNNVNGVYYVRVVMEDQVFVKQVIKQ